MSTDDADAWYADGLRFRCTACGACCTGEPGDVWVTREEIQAMAKVKGLSARQFAARYVRRRGRRTSLEERENGDCVMLVDGRCSVHEVKPERCATYPFWDGILATERAWWEQAARCEGIGQGDHYSAEEIERLRRGDRWPLVAKHLREPEQPVHSRHADGAAAATPPAALELADVDWPRAFAALERVYADLDDELPRWEFTCAASGDCCDFDAHGHRLYVTTLEAMYFFARQTRRETPEAAHCPAWGADRLCKQREGRMLGCRTYHCGPYPRGVPEELHPRYHARIQALHTRFEIPYAYKDVVAWASDCLPAAGPPAAGP